MGVRQNNLKGFDLDLPLGQLIVVTGPSGAGKSSLVFDTLHAEGQRRYVETFSPYTRQFLEMLDRPKVDRIENIRPSIAIEQTNTVRTSRSTVGTMTELTDFAKVWFSHVSHLYDPATGERIQDDHPDAIWPRLLAAAPGESVLLAFPLVRPENHTWPEIFASLLAQGYTRVILRDAEDRPLGPARRLDGDEAPLPEGLASLAVIQDRLTIGETERTRFLEAATTALPHGRGRLLVLAKDGSERFRFSTGLTSPRTGRRFAPATAALFSFNSPLGACPKCRGFGRVIELDRRLVVPDTSLSLRDKAIRAFTGEVYAESQRDLERAAKKIGLRLNVPYRDLTAEELHFVWEGEPDYREGENAYKHAWYGVRRFFEWLESNTYKMHVRVFLSKYRAYVQCPVCAGSRLLPDALLWQWQGRTLPDLYRLTITEFLALLDQHVEPTGVRPVDLATEAIRTRLRYLVEVGVGYLTLDRASRTLSGGEVERVNLTTCLGTSLTDTLFVLDEPSVGLHARDIDRLIGILRRLTDQGNTVVVVEHDEAVMRAADQILEIGPEPGARGGHLVFQGTGAEILTHATSLTGAYLSGRRQVPRPAMRRPVVDPTRPGRRAADGQVEWLVATGATHHNLQDLDVRVPLRRLVALSGVSGSGKSTILKHVLHQGVLAARGQVVDAPATLRSLTFPETLGEVVLVDQSPVSRTPRSNPALFVDAWDPIRDLLASTEAARQTGLTASHFSFNSGDGRCETCQGLGAERVEMQFMADIFVPCPTCDGRRFKPEVLQIAWHDHSVSDLLALDVATALTVFAEQPKIRSRLQLLADVGLGYLPLGQGLHTLSGGEAQRLKLVRYLGHLGADRAGALLLLDEPTTGLHRDDVARLLGVLHRLVDGGHSVVVIEHQMDVLAAADWILEVGPEAGAGGGKIVYAGPPEGLATAGAATSPFLAAALAATDEPVWGLAAEAAAPYRTKAAPVAALEIIGAREHNLQDLSVSFAHRQFHVVTGVSGSGKSSLAFDIIFAEGQRRFMESMSSYARQFVEQLPRPELDQLTGIPPTVAIEQRVTRGSRKSTVATITEVAQYLRLLYARLGLPHSPITGQPLVALRPGEVAPRLTAALAQYDGRGGALHLLAPLVRGRKGHHQPLADWARQGGYAYLRADGQLVEPEKFKKLDRFKEHDVEVVVATWNRPSSRAARTLATRDSGPTEEAAALTEALKLGRGTAFLGDSLGRPLAWFSTRRTDPATGEAFPDLDPKHFSWNSARGWCAKCRGHGRLFSWMTEHPDFQEQLTEDERDDLSDGTLCPDCAGTRLQPLARAVRLPVKDGRSLNLPELLALPPGEMLATLRQLDLDRRGQTILREVRPEIEERLKFLDEVGLDYLTLDRPTNTLSGGEAQRIRLAAQLGSNLSGVLYVLDEPSIGLHARDNDRLLASLRRLQAKGNTLIVVEHDEDTMRAADRILDLGPGAGRHGGRILAQGTLTEIMRHPESVTGQSLRAVRPHPRRGHRRPVPPTRGKAASGAWITLDGPTFRNLKGGMLRFPRARLVGLCGPSGAGKSTLLRDLLQPAVAYAIAHELDSLSGAAAQAARLYSASAPSDIQVRAPFKMLKGVGGFRKVIEVDQSPIGQTPRSTPATYIGAWDLIRELYGRLPEANLRGYTPSTFSFNTAGGRCERCKGAGRLKLEMSFLPETWVDCDGCHGRRFSSDLDGVVWQGKSIADVLALTFDEAAPFFSFHSRLSALCGLMVETGLGYLTLGQSSPTLSGGEAQRLKLVSELALGLPSYQDRQRGQLPQNLYLLEEPTIGLHLSDCDRLVELLHRLVDQGHTVIVIEHHIDLLAETDWLLELGPDGGTRGGHLLAQGPPEQVAATADSPTAPYLRGKLGMD